MKYLLRLLVVLMMGSAYAQSNLPACQGSDVTRWSNCEGSGTNANGDKFLGEFKDGAPNGQGTLTFANRERYVGEFKDGKPNGRGTQYSTRSRIIRQGVWTDGNFVGSAQVQQATGPKPVCRGGDYSSWSNCVGTLNYGFGWGRFSEHSKYVGEFKDGARNGQGTLTNQGGGDEYVGEFKDNMPHGQGTLIVNGNKGYKFVGEFKDGKRDGQGTMTLANGDKYVGEWKYNNPNGQGAMYSSNGSITNQGIWADGNFVGSAPVQQATGPKSACEGSDVTRWSNCVGAETYAFGDKFVGEFKDGKRNGQGTYTYTKGDKYVGEYRDDKRNGQGTYTAANGQKYVGEFKDGKFNGQGTMTLANGGKYVGEWKDDKPNGQGTEYSINGRINRQGIWDEGSLVNQQRKVPNKVFVERLREEVSEAKKRQAEAE